MIFNPIIYSNLDGIVDGTITSFVMPNGKTTIEQYRFYNFTALTSADLGACKTVKQYAFYGCTNVQCTPPTTLTTIGNYAFYNFGRNKSGFEFNPANTCSVGSYAFQASRVTKVTGTLSISSYGFYQCTYLTEVDIAATSVSDYAFYGCTAMTSLKATINGAVGSYAFYNAYNLSSVEISADSVITSVGSYAFSRFASGRSSASDNIITLDFTNSTFTTINQYAFGGDSSSTSYKNQYMKLIFPSTVATINQYAFRYTDNCDFYFNGTTPPTLSATTCWNNATNYKIFVPFGAINAYKTATNWTAQTDYIRGFAAAGTFAAGDTLPTLNAEGYELTWYSDKDCTTEITAAEDGDTEYYCLAGDEKVGFGITSITALECEVTITDEDGNTYVAGSGVMKDTVLTITATPTTEGYVPYTFTVNGEDFTSGGTITVSADITITAIYYDGENLPVNPTFSENTWTMIREAFRSGIAATIGWAVGDTKEVTLTDGRTYNVRIADMQSGRYELSDGTGYSNGVLEFVECINANGTTSFNMNSSSTNSGGWASSRMKTVHMETIYALLPDDVKAAISTVKVLSGTGAGTTSGVSSSDNTLFLPAEMEIFANKHYSIGNTECPLGQFDYYAAITTADGNTCTERQKCTVDTTTTRWWWLRSPHSGDGSYFCSVHSSGSYGSYYASYTGGVSPCFAI